MTGLATPPVLTEISARLLTVADLAVLPSELPSGTVRYELDDGRLIIRAPNDYFHATAETNLAAELALQGRGLGRVTSGGVGVILRRRPDRVVGADVLFIAKESLPVRVSPEDYLETIPELAVEIRGLFEPPAEVQHKVSDYLQAGVRVLWVADPEKQTITVHRSGQAAQVLGVQDTLTVEDVIPGFQMPVRDVFVI